MKRIAYWCRRHGFYGLYRLWSRRHYARIYRRGAR